MRLLIDENLSPNLADRLSDCFPESTHVRGVGLLGGNDPDVWALAKDRGYCILTKDTDFQSRSMFDGAPPKVILVRLGNCSTSSVEIAIRSSLEAITAFESDLDSAMLVVP
jgi:predicted nuclease of predicted toxin-antitoxin system